MTTPEVEEASIKKFRASLIKFEYTSPVHLRRSPRNHLVRTKVEPEPEQGEADSGSRSTRLSKAPYRFKQDVEDDMILPTLLPDGSGSNSPRKRKSESPTKLQGRSASPKKLKRGFAPPETYAHLNVLKDYLKDYLDVMFCGINPGCKSAEVGHHFAHPTNHFWRCLHQSDLTDRLLSPSEGPTLLERYNLGLTNLVARPSAEQAELSKEEKVNGVPILLLKIVRFRPYVVCFVGKDIWEVFHRHATKGVLLSAQDSLPESSMTPLPSSSASATSVKEEEGVLQDSPEKSSAATNEKGRKGKRKTTTKAVFSWGLQPYKVVHPAQAPNENAPSETLFFVMPSTSGRVVSHQLQDKVKIFVDLRERVLELKQIGIDTATMTPIPAALVQH